MQFDLINNAINVYTPKIGRDNLNDEVFDLIRSLISNTDKSLANRIVVLKTKLVSFALTPRSKKILI